ncbi:hypothetical protein TYRP_001287 [Tyrophagus putrescentiae]|nr:hypothetical protein TYRP_001287 [Tyrophagus putrescentiae]
MLTGGQPLLARGDGQQHQQQQAGNSAENNKKQPTSNAKAEMGNQLWTLLFTAGERQVLQRFARLYRVHHHGQGAKVQVVAAVGSRIQVPVDLLVRLEEVTQVLPKLVGGRLEALVGGGQLEH